MSKTSFPQAAWQWADPLWWVRQQIRAATYVAHMTEAMVRVYGDAARYGVHAFAHGSTPWAIATAAPAPAPVAHVNGAGPKIKAAEPTPELAVVPPVAELTAVPAPPELTVVPSVAPEQAPVPGWDELTLGSIRARLRRLSEYDLDALYAWEEGHAARADVLSMLANRLLKIRSAAHGA